MYRRFYFLLAQKRLMFFWIACKEYNFPEKYRIPSYYFYLNCDWIDEFSSTFRIQFIKNKEIMVHMEKSRNLHSWAKFHVTLFLLIFMFLNCLPYEWKFGPFMHEIGVIMSKLVFVLLTHVRAMHMQIVCVCFYHYNQWFTLKIHFNGLHIQPRDYLKLRLYRLKWVNK